MLSEHLPAVGRRQWKSLRLVEVSVMTVAW